MTTRDKSELERGLENFGRALTGVTARLLGPRSVGRETLPPEAAISPEADAALEKVISPEADAALEKVGEDLGRVLHAAGEALKEHPLDPEEALKAAKERASEPVVAEEGWSPLASGLANLGGGLAKVAEGVLDVVAPRKPKGDAERAAGDDGTAAASSDAADPAPPESSGAPRAP
jgi:hypothetical protein